MGDFAENIVNQRFRIIYESLKSQGVIKGKSDLADKLGTYNHVINHILKGERNITVDQLHKLFETYGIDANFVFGISDQIFIDGQAPGPALAVHSRKEVSRSLRTNIVLVPVRAMAGDALVMDWKDLSPDFQRFSLPGYEGELWAIEVDGDSMLPTITKGDWIICELLEQGEPLRDNQVYVLNTTNGIVVKRIQQVRESGHLTGLRLISDNASVYKPYLIGLEDFDKIFKVRCRLTEYAIS